MTNFENRDNANNDDETKIKLKKLEYLKKNMA
jgi:hypothetical protein